MCRHGTSKGFVISRADRNVAAAFRPFSAPNVRFYVPEVDAKWLAPPDNNPNIFGRATTQISQNEMSSHSTMTDRQAQESTPANTLQNLHAEEFGLFLQQASERLDALTVLERGFFCTCLLCGPNPALHRNGPIANVALPPPARYVRRIRRGSLPPSGPADQTTASSKSSGAACKGPVP